MTDPKFTARAELEKWAHRRALAILKALEDIRRVTLAHAHLLGDE